jgi:aminopeptidase N
MDDTTPQTVRLSDYRPVPYLIETVDLDFGLEPERTRVRSLLNFRPNPASSDVGAPLVLDGDDIELVSLVLDGKVLSTGDYELAPPGLVIGSVPQRDFILEIVTFCNPKANTQLSGLYLSSGIFCTQCEAEGFRRITFFYDRPDVMARYSVRVEADRTACPVLLSNGNPGASGIIEGTNRHFAIWHDPFPKPSYLFALVAGDLAAVKDSFGTRSGRKVDLGIYVEKGKENRCDWAMESLKTSMRWDEEAFGREYDLDVFNIVAVSDFNMGAMENKGLNIFNDKYILALPNTATDLDYINIEAIIAHEYFHNWTGNRITCRDWFQLCLKEGLTVYRDQEFTSDIRSRPVKRIADVRRLRADQFPEDGGPLAHPVRPSSYIEINNFYTATVYEKGAELCRMMKTLIGDAAFRKAMDTYFERHDGEAATVEDFVRCMADASGRDMRQFFRWYEQSGTPQVVVSGKYDPEAQTYDLTLKQVTAATPGQPRKEPYVIPLRLGLVAPDGADMPLDLDDVGVLNTPQIELTQRSQSYRFRNVASRPALSINRGFSAPVRISGGTTLKDRLFLMGHDSDPFNRWEAAQTAGTSLVVAAMKAVNGTGKMPSLAGFIEALRRILKSPDLDDAFRAALLVFPGEQEIASAIGQDIDPSIVHEARDRVRRAFAIALSAELNDVWNQTSSNGPYRPAPAETGRRSLRYAVLSLMAAGDPLRATALAQAVLAAPQSMTDELGALQALSHIEGPAREAAIEEFYQRHRNDHLLVDKWFALQAQIPEAATAHRVRQLMRHPEFRITTPNRVRGLIGTFAMANPNGFNAPDGEGYRVLADTVLALDGKNPQVAARISTAFRSWRMLESNRRALVRIELERILSAPQLSRDVYEIVSKSLA